MASIKLGNKHLDTVARKVYRHAARLFNFPAGMDLAIIKLPIGKDLARAFPTVCGGFIVEMNSKLGWTDEKFVRTLGHELTHVKQYFSKEMTATLDTRDVMWHGKLYRAQNEAEYYLAPWEIEARGMEEYFWWRACKRHWV